MPCVTRVCVYSHHLTPSLNEGIVWPQAKRKGTCTRLAAQKGAVTKDEITEPSMHACVQKYWLPDEVPGANYFANL